MMRKFTKALAGASIAAGLVLGGSVTGASAWESVGLKTRYPSVGGTWQYGFSNAALRSYYTVNKCHGSSVQKTENGKIVNTSRSINTASGKKSIAEIATLNYASLDGNYFYRTC
ncbi:hypothetical protein JSY14_06005 [Brachybacterium sp. EF45031]|uniref:lactococcin 972 family bacteriocin n=1 Tax=Brachybacterium sillae TaxID=2810536 RepID=UPI00217E7470|nr:lactococcin 972 family bacteriocin [Brachybacterium sillae]MCS6711600.1 hypothetical protein [Brachybacterium sillae]